MEAAGPVGSFEAVGAEIVALGLDQVGRQASPAVAVEIGQGGAGRDSALIFAFGICFQLPVIMTLLARVGLATSKGMAEKRKYAIVGVFIAAAVFTPPDPISQISLAIPIILLYEISIYMAKLVERKRGKDEYDDEYDDDDDELDEDETTS